MSVSIHRIKLKDLSLIFFQQLKEQYLDEDMEIEIRVHPKYIPPELYEQMTEEEFWAIIDLLDWGKEGDDEAVIEPAVKFLSQLSAKKMASFQDILSERLYHLDGQKYASHIGENAYDSEGYFSADIFLYARCCVVANGRELYEHVLLHPEDMPKDITFESLLYIADEAHQKKTGKPMRHVPAFNYETFFNSEGWGSKEAKLYTKNKYFRQKTSRGN